jgi:hypothetical protein
VRPMAIVALGLLGLLIGAGIALYRERRRDSGLSDTEREGYQQQVAMVCATYEGMLARQEVRHRAELEVAHEELHKALDRVQAPEWAVQDSQAERAIRNGNVDPGITGAVQELPLSKEMLERQEQLEVELERKLRERGVDPSELRSASAGFREVDQLDGS